MNALTFTRVSFVIGLALGLIVFWVAATPNTSKADLLIGGWTLGGGCCNGATQEPCPKGPQGPYGCRVGYSTWVCIPSSYTGKLCQAQGSDPCDEGGIDTCWGSNTLCY